MRQKIDQFLSDQQRLYQENQRQKNWDHNFVQLDDDFCFEESFSLFCQVFENRQFFQAFEIVQKMEKFIELDLDFEFDFSQKQKLHQILFKILRLNQNEFCYRFLNFYYAILKKKYLTFYFDQCILFEVVLKSKSFQIKKILLKIILKFIKNKSFENQMFQDENILNNFVNNFDQEHPIIISIKLTCLFQLLRLYQDNLFEQIKDIILNINYTQQFNNQFCQELTQIYMQILKISIKNKYYLLDLNQLIFNFILKNQILKNETSKKLFYLYLKQHVISNQKLLPEKKQLFELFYKIQQFSEHKKTKIFNLCIDHRNCQYIEFFVQNKLILDTYLNCLHYDKSSIFYLNNIQKYIQQNRNQNQTNQNKISDLIQKIQNENSCNQNLRQQSTQKLNEYFYS